jgi:signal peptidase
VPDDAPRQKGYLSVVKGFIAIGIAIVLIFVILFAYSGLWPPIVVVESDSMQHSDTRSFIGTIDTGDILIVQKVRGSQDVVTYLEGIANGYKTYGEYGDVVTYQKYGLSGTPIIHRAICEIVYNESGHGFDIPSLAHIPNEQWSVQGAPVKTYWNLNGVVEIDDVGYLQVTLRLDLSSMLSYFSSRGMHPHGGLITMGDHNVQSNGTALLGYYDQLSICREPIKNEWLVGKARGELPWFGLVKLWATGTLPHNTPQNSVTNLVITIALIIGLPIALDISNVLLKRRGIEIFGWTKKLSLKRLRRKPEEDKPKEGERGTAPKDAAPQESERYSQTRTEKKGKGKSK